MRADGDGAPRCRGVRGTLATTVEGQRAGSWSCSGEKFIRKLP